MRCRYFMLSIHLLLIMIFATSCIWQERLTIKQDEVGIIYERYSNELLMDSILTKGAYRNPIWNDVIILNIGEKHEVMNFTFDSIDNSSVNIRYTIGFKPIPDSLPYLYKQYRDDYLVKLITPINHDLAKDILIDLNHQVIEDKIFSSELDKTIKSSILTNYFENLSISNLEILQIKDVSL